MHRRRFRFAAAAVAMLAGAALADPLTSAFTYQGRLLQGGNAPTALYDFQFSLFDAASGGSLQGTTVQLSNVPVTNGLFTVNLDFGPEYNDARRFLQIAVRTAGGASYTALLPRQELTATPHAQALALPVWETTSVPTGVSLLALTNTGTGEGISVITAGGSTSEGGVVASAGGLNSNGVVGVCSNGPQAYGVWGQSNSGTGVVGSGGPYGGSFAGAVGSFSAAVGSGAAGIGALAIGGQNGFVGVRGESTVGGTDSYGVLGLSFDPNGNGVRGDAGNGAGAYGVWGNSSSGVGVNGSGAAAGGTFTGAAGVIGTSTASGFNAVGVLGLGGSGDIGVEGRSSSGAASSYGGYFTSTTNGGNGVYGEASADASSYGVWGDSSTGVAGQFSGNVNITGNLWVNGSKHFRIDHPLDPANYYLVHSCVESDQQVNIYKGHISLDGAGRAVVELPSYFQALNTDVEYHLTAIGAPAPGLYIAQKVANNRFAIAGGLPGQEVSWQVMGVRQDPYTLAHPMVVEEPKVGNERGRYTHPELYGLPESFNVLADKLAAARAHAAAAAQALPSPKAAQPLAPAPAAPQMKGGN